MYTNSPFKLDPAEVGVELKQLKEKKSLSTRRMWMKKNIKGDL